MQRVLGWCLMLLFIGDLAAQPQATVRVPPSEFLRTNPAFLKSFHEVVRKAAGSVVRVQCDGKDVALGVVVSADGWILTKANDLAGKITCRLKDGRAFDAKLVGVQDEHDLALLKIKAQSLTPAVFASSASTRSGNWVASVGMEDDPVAVGVVSVATRKVNEAYLGVIVNSSPSGLIVQATLDNGAAMKAGVRPKDLIVRVNGRSFTEPDSLADFLAGRRPGDSVALSIQREGKSIDVKAILQSRNEAGGFRAEFQNRLGSDLSSRRGGYPVILQHDSVVRPKDCGGPLVDLQGRVVGVNISRAGRVETWAIPAELIPPLLVELKSGRLAPKKKSAS